jgi:hypothetical protein
VKLWYWTKIKIEKKGNGLKLKWRRVYWEDGGKNGKIAVKLYIQYTVVAFNISELMLTI